MVRKSGYFWAAVLLMNSACTPPITNLPIPSAMSECEVEPCAKNIGIWTFNGPQGLATWPSWGVVGNLSVERFDTGSIVIRRVNRTDSVNAGVVVVYTGTIDGNQINGKFARKAPSGATSSGAWHAHIGTQQEQQAQVQWQQQALQQVAAAQQQNAASQQKANAAGMAALATLFVGLAGAAAMMPDSGGGGGSGPSDEERFNQNMITEENHSYVEQHGGVSGPYMR